MCGLAGFCDHNNKSSGNILVKMLDSIRHRGPDDSGTTFLQQHNAQIGLGHRRLSIIDTSSLGHQPMSYLDYEIILNGEIYNYAEIRKELEQLGYSFRSHSDTEVILIGFHKWGMKVLEKFIGMFAFALLDKSKSKLYLVRDRIGVKPLYYYHKNEILLFASEIKAFHQHPGFRKTLNQAGLTTYFQFGYSICPDTIFEDTFQVRPGCYIELDIKKNELHEITYWKIEDHYINKASLSEAEILHDIESLLTSSANYRMVADVPVGMFLSGGYDSSTISALLQKDRSEKIKTFTIGFKEDEFNEAPHAKKVAAYLGTDHTEHYCSMDDALNLIPEMPFHFDEPFADYSSIPTMLVSELARKKVTVALSADGGDELFGGYPKYLHALKYQKLRKFFPNLLAKPFKHIYDYSSSTLLSNTSLARFTTTSNKIGELITGETAIDFARVNVQLFEEKSLDKLLVHNRGKTNTLFYDNNFFDPFQDLDSLLLLDFKIFLPDDLLVKIDRATMRVSLEGREPLLDHRLIEYMGKINARSKLDVGNNTTKFYLKKIAHKYIPKDLLDRPKMGFTPPLAAWMHGPLREYVETYMNKKLIESQGLLNYTVIAAIKNDFYKQKYNKASKKIWNILMFQMWFEKWMS